METAAKLVDGIAHAGAANDGTSGLTQLGFDCIVIPGAFTNTVADSTVIVAQTAAGLQQRVTAAGTLLTAGQGPQICGNNGGIGAGVEKIATMAATTANGLLVGQGEASSTSVCSKYIEKFISNLKLYTRFFKMWDSLAYYINHTFMLF